jgi:hypothetical protein
MGDVRSLVADPEFAKLPLSVRSDALRRVGAPDTFISEYVKLVAKGPMLSPGGPSSGFEDTSKDVADILERRHEPNRARDVLPKLALFAAQGAMAAQAPAAIEGVGAWASALRGASAATKASATAKAAGTLAMEGAKFYAANEGMKALHVPEPIREVALIAAGVTRPGESARGALRTLIKGEAAPAVAAAERAAAPAVEAVLPAGQRAMPTNLGGAARPGAAPTTDLEEALQATADALRVGKPAGPLRPGQPTAAPPENLGTLAAGKPSGALQPERIQVGAQKLGRKLGMTKEQVRMEAGPVLDEELGMASDVLPQEAINGIAEKIKALPRGAARTAYVKLANSHKAMVNVEIGRRFLESQGLVLPFAAVAGLLIEAQAKGKE